jgi:hypothetical protein
LTEFIWATLPSHYIGMSVPWGVIIFGVILAVDSYFQHVSSPRAMCNVRATSVLIKNATQDKCEGVALWFFRILLFLGTGFVALMLLVQIGNTVTAPPYTGTAHSHAMRMLVSLIVLTFAQEASLQLAQSLFSIFAFALTLCRLSNCVRLTNNTATNNRVVGLTMPVVEMQAAALSTLIEMRCGSMLKDKDKGIVCALQIDSNQSGDPLCVLHEGARICKRFLGRTNSTQKRKFHALASSQLTIGNRRLWCECRDREELDCVGKHATVIREFFKKEIQRARIDTVATSVAPRQ